MRAVFAVIFTFNFTAAVAGDFEDGMDAALRNDYATALAKWRSEANKENPKAQNELGAMYAIGKGVSKDYKEALRWFDLAAKKGNRDAQFNLGFMYENGQGVAQDYKEAARWYRLAAKQGFTEAQFNLGFMYHDGKGVAQDIIRAHMWFNIAAVSGDKGSVKNRDIAASKMTSQQIEQAQRMARECMASNFTKCD